MGEHGSWLPEEDDLGCCDYGNQNVYSPLEHACFGPCRSRFSPESHYFCQTAGACVYYPCGLCFCAHIGGLQCFKRCCLCQDPPDVDGVWNDNGCCDYDYWFQCSCINKTNPCTAVCACMLCWTEEPIPPVWMRRYRRSQEVWVRRMDWKEEHPPKVQDMQDPKEQDHYLHDYLKEKRGENLTAAQRNQIDLEVRQQAVAAQNMEKAKAEAARQAEAGAIPASEASNQIGKKPLWKSNRSKQLTVVPVPSVYTVPVEPISPRVLKASNREEKKSPLETTWRAYKESNEAAPAPLGGARQRKVRKNSKELSGDGRHQERMPTGVGELSKRERLKRKQELARRKLSFEYEEKAKKVDENCQSEIVKVEQEPLVR